MRDHRHLLAREQLGDRVVVIGVRVSDEHAQQRLPERLEACSEGAAVGEQQRRVDRDDPVGAFGQVGVDEQAGLAGAVSVHDRSHAPSVRTASRVANTDPV
jgi:hypothetical protein